MGYRCWQAPIIRIEIIMQEDGQTVKEILLKILDKCRQTLPEVAVLTSRFDKLSLQAGTIKIRKKDCLNPIFLLQLSQCGEKIKTILTEALQQEGVWRQPLRKSLKEYMQIIHAIRKYHEEAHLSHNMHKNSTAMKQNLLKELNLQAQRRKEAERRLSVMAKDHALQMEEMAEHIRELQDQIGHSDENGQISQISKITKKADIKYGQLYGGESKVGQIQENESSIEAKRLRRKVMQLQQLLQQRQQLHLQEIESQRNQIVELQSKFNQYVRESRTSNQSLGSEGVSMQKDMKLGIFTNATSRENGQTYDQLYRVILAQASTIEQYLHQSDAD